MSYTNIPLVAELYEHQNYRGHKIVVVTNVSKLTDYGFNDKVSSIRVLAGPTPRSTAYVELHRDERFRGGTRRLRAGESISDLGREHLNDRISSLRFRG